ncbi:MAG: type II secretion system protein GspC [Colwellia sp.]|nr:type II secretion system protein GspC [Colwellia sp.]
MALSDNLTSLSVALAVVREKTPQQKIAQAISLLLLVYIAFVAAKITWLMVPQKQVANNTATSKYTAQKNYSGQSFNISALQSLNLFGQYNEQVKEDLVEQVTDAPETRLQLTLSGVVASDKAETSAAIIENKGKQETYGIGDIIKGTRASLEQVLTDRVIIKQSGRLETLMLDGADYNQPAQRIANKNVNQKSNSKQGSKSLKQRELHNSPQRLTPKLKSSVVDQRSNNNLSRSAQRLRTDLKNDPGKITDYLRISPARKGGKIVGYRLSPGKNPEFFKLSGLKTGDVAVQMNGHDLLVPMEAAQAMSALKTQRDISLLVERKNDLIEILFSIE